MGYCILNVQIGGYNGKRRKRNSSGFKRNVWNNVCKLDAVIDYGSLSLTARHMETVIIFCHGLMDMSVHYKCMYFGIVDKNFRCIY